MEGWPQNHSGFIWYSEFFPLSYSAWCYESKLVCESAINSLKENSIEIQVWYITWKEVLCTDIKQSLGPEFKEIWVQISALLFISYASLGEKKSLDLPKPLFSHIWMEITGPWWQALWRLNEDMQVGCVEQCLKHCIHSKKW